MANQNPGWVQRELRAFRPAAALPEPEIKREQGFGIRILRGAHYVKQLDMIVRGQDFSTEPDELTDGQWINCPLGFDALRFHFSDDVPINSQNAVSRVVYRIAKVPYISTVESEGPRGAVVQLLDSVLHQDPGVGTTVVPAASSLLVHDGPANLYQAYAGNLPGTIKQSLTVGDSLHRQLVTPALFFHGFIASDVPDINVWCYAYTINGNGNLEPVFYFNLDNASGRPAENGTGGPGATTYVRVHHLSGRPQNFNQLRDPIPYPLNGCQIYVQNTHVSNPANIKGILAVRSA